MASAMASSPEIRVVGFLDDDDRLHGHVLNGLPIHNPADLAEVLNGTAITDVLLALPSVSRQRRNEILNELKPHKVAVRTLPGLSDIATGKVSLSDVRELDIDDLLGREPVKPNGLLLNLNTHGKTVLVTGAGSLWTNTGNLYVGNFGSGNSLVISNGGTVLNAMGFIGSQSNAVGNLVTVTGSNSSWINSGDLYVGYAGQSNRLVISNGGFVSNVNGFDDGVDPMDAYNSVLVTGAGSRWSNSGNLTFGLAGHDNSLVISNGGIVTVGVDSKIGDLATASNNSVLVTGPSSIWTNSGTLYVGNYGSGNSLVISNGGRVLNAG
jgi:T5SS/PEP-CTERM-associated repeat protein